MSSPGWTPPPPPAIAQYAAPTLAPTAIPVWVLLERHWRHDPAQARTVIDGLDTTGRTRGFLHQRYRTSRGDWVAKVSFEVYYIDGRPLPVVLSGQLVPFYALEPRHDSKPLGLPR